jgi:hypothetical protein
LVNWLILFDGACGKTGLIIHTILMVCFEEGDGGELGPDFP